MYSLNKHKLGKKEILLRQDRKLFHTNDLALLWKITNQNTLHTTIRRYLKNKTLLPIHKGFYSVAPFTQIDPLVLGSAFLHHYAYLSTESILVKVGIVAQVIPVITFVANVSKRFKLKEVDYLARQMKSKYLYNTAGVVQKKGYHQAIPERAVADLLYYNPRYHFDNDRAIDWEKVKQIQKEVGF